MLTSQNGLPSRAIGDLNETSHDVIGLTSYFLTISETTYCHSNNSSLSRKSNVLPVIEIFDFFVSGKFHILMKLPVYYLYITSLLQTIFISQPHVG